jgi:hypothetical protein
MSETPSCNCFIARHPKRETIEEAIRAHEDPRHIAKRFGVSKTKVYEHRRHLGASLQPPALSSSPAERPAEREGSFRGTVERPARDAARVQPQLPEMTGGTACGIVRGMNYPGAVKECVALISGGEWRQNHIQDLVERFGLTTSRARQAKAEAGRFLAINMGDYTEKQMVSVSYTWKHRDDCRERGEACLAQAATWAERERAATLVAEACGDPEQRVLLFEGAARAGLVAAKYGLEAEKWMAQTLKAQQHGDDILCLKAPAQVVNATQVNIGGNGEDLFGRFARALGTRFKDHPDILAAIDKAAADIEAGKDAGDAAAIEAVGESA